MTNTALKTQIDTDITNKSATKSITPLNVGSNTKAIVDYVDQESNLKENLSNKSTNVTTDATSNTKYPSVKAIKDYVDAKLPYKVYTALISQSGTSAPTLVVLQNTLGDTITSLYNGVGNYTLQLATLNLFIYTKTFILLNSSYNSNAYLGIVRGDDNELLVTSVYSGSNSNNVISDASIEIRVYN